MTETGRKSAFERIKAFYLMPFRAIGSAMRRFSLNRARVREFSRRPKVASALKYGMAATMLLWFAIAWMNRGEDDGRLSTAIEQLWSKPTNDTVVPQGSAD